MKTLNKYIPFILCLIFFILVITNINIVKLSILESIKIWFYNLVPFMFIMYLVIDLLLNYGLLNISNNSLLIYLISIFIGTPGNSKYICEFKDKGYISYKKACMLLTFSYSPNPLFILGIFGYMDTFLILGYIYLTNLLNFILFNREDKSFKYSNVNYIKKDFNKVLNESIDTSFNILLLILGVITFYKVLIDLICLLNINNPYILSLLELTNGIFILRDNNINFLYIVLVVAFGGLSIHTQIKSILVKSNIPYKYFLFGRIISIIPLLLILFLKGLF